MKRYFVFVVSVLAITFACKSKKAAVSTTSNEAAIDKQLAAVKTRFPDATREELQMGHNVYAGACTKCHGQKDVTAYTEPRLLEIVDAMARKANITAQEKQALIRFAVGVRATSN